MYFVRAVTQLLFRYRFVMLRARSFHGGRVRIVNIEFICKELKDISDFFSAVAVTDQKRPAVADRKGGVGQ